MIYANQYNDFKFLAGWAGAIFLNTSCNFNFVNSQSNFSKNNRMDKTVKIELDEFQAELYINVIAKHLEEWKEAKRKLRPGKLSLHFDSGFNAKFEFNYFPGKKNG